MLNVNLGIQLVLRPNLMNSKKKLNYVDNVEPLLFNLKRLTRKVNVVV